MFVFVLRQGNVRENIKQIIAQMLQENAKKEIIKMVESLCSAACA